VTSNPIATSYEHVASSVDIVFFRYEVLETHLSVNSSNLVFDATFHFCGELTP